MSVKHGQLSKGFAVLSQQAHYEVGFWLLALLVIGSVWATYASFFPLNDLSASLSTFREGAEIGAMYRPFTYRVLLPLMTAAVGQVFPLTPVIYSDIFIFFALIGFTIGFRTLAHHFWEPSWHLDYVVLLSIPLIIPFTLVHPHNYDMMTLCLSTWCIVLLAQKRWMLFLVCYTFACFNKETTLFITLMFIVCYAQEYKSQWYWRLLAMQLGIYAPIRVSLMYIFREFPGGVVEYHLWDHIVAYLADPFRTCVYIVSSGFIAALVFYRLRSKPLFLRKALFAVLPIMIVLYFPLGFPYEIRIFYDVYAPLLLICMPPNYFRLRNYSIRAGQYRFS